MNDIDAVDKRNKPGRTYQRPRPVLGAIDLEGFDQIGSRHEGNQSSACQKLGCKQNHIVDKSMHQPSSDVEVTDCANFHLPTITLHTKDIHRQGYLYKQGGFDCNKGWNKRWFTFDGDALKYFPDEKSSVSLRIIPVAMMKSVAADGGRKSMSSATDLFQSSGRQYQFTLECTHRTFLFGTENIDNCQQWQSTIMAAIIDFKKVNGVLDRPYGGEMNSPDISGMVKFGANKTKCFVVLKGDKLRYYQNLADYAEDFPIHELSMSCTSVKEIKKAALQLNSAPNQCFILQFESETDAIQWKIYIENAMARALGDDEVLKKVREKEDNRVCAECSSNEPEWASINLGLVLCIKCSGPHRRLGVKRSKVRSLRMDNIFRQNENVIQLLHEIGNKNGNSFWSNTLENGAVIDMQTSDIDRQRHIEEKYLTKKYADLMTHSSQEELDEALFSAVGDGAVIPAMRALFSGADINFMCPSQQKTVFDVAEESGNNVVKEFLEQNRYTDVGTVREDIKEITPLQHSAKKTALYHEGYLVKTGPNLKGYTKRWCVLHYGEISYFADKSAAEVKGCVDLTDATSVSIVTGQRQYCFDINIETKNRTYRFAAPDEASFKQWLSCLIQDSTAVPVEKITISKGTQCFQCNIGKHTPDIVHLDSNHRVEIMAEEGHILAYLQGRSSKDTKRLFTLLDSLSRRS